MPGLELYSPVSRIPQPPHGYAMPACGVKGGWGICVERVPRPGPTVWVAGRAVARVQSAPPCPGLHTAYHYAHSTFHVPDFISNTKYNFIKEKTMEG